MKHKVSELEGALLDAAVAKALGVAARVMDDSPLHNGPVCVAEMESDAAEEGFFEPSSLWDHGGPIIERERIVVTPSGPIGWGAFRPTGIEVSATFVLYSGLGVVSAGPTPLIAAMRAYVASKFGDEVDIP